MLGCFQRRILRLPCGFSDCHMDYRLTLEPGFSRYKDREQNAQALRSLLSLRRLGNDLNMASLPVVLVLLVFVAGSGATWIAGVELAKSTDELDRRLRIGDALGGMVLLAITGSLPELAVTISAAESGHLGLAAGNLIGGIATATMVLVACDLC